MTDLVLSDVDPDLVEQLRQQARLHGSSIEGEAKLLLARAAAAVTAPTEPGLGERMTRRFETVGLRTGESLERPGWDGMGLADLPP